MATSAPQAVLSLIGQDAVSFLQGVCTADVKAWAASGADTPLYTCHLTPKGRVVSDFFVFRDPQNSKTLHLQCHAEALMPLAHSFQPFTVGQQVAFHDNSTEINFPNGRKVLAKNMECRENQLPDAFIDGVQSGARALPAEVGLTHIVARGFPPVSFKKGCYVGQEVTTRLHHLGTPKRQLVRWEMLETDGQKMPQTGDALVNEKGKTVGYMGGVWQTETGAVQGRAVMTVKAITEGVFWGEEAQLIALHQLPWWPAA